MRLALLAVALPLAAARAQVDDARISALVDRHTPRSVEFRHTIHQNPELSNRETATAALVASHLRLLGMEVRTGIAHTGVVGVLRGSRPGPVVAVRADMDALPVTENTPFPWRSTLRTTYQGREVGVMHACGHDIHVAVLLGTASVLAELRERLAGTVLFVFQPAEEGAPPGERGGAALMLEEGVFSDPRPAAVFGLHTNIELPVGVVGYTPGATFSGSMSWRATIRGRQAHAAQPNLAIDPIVIASEIVLALQTIRSRTLSPFTPSVVTVGSIHGGERRNIIPAEVQLEGTVRTFSTAVEDSVRSRMRALFEGITQAHGASFELHLDQGLPPVVNDSALLRRALPALQRAVGRDNVRLIGPWSASEDFSYFANVVPAFFFSIGGLAPGTTSGGHHTPTFQADDGAVAVGIRAMTTLVLDYMNGGNR